MKPHNELKKGQSFKNIKSGQILNIMYGCHGNHNHVISDGPVIIYYGYFQFVFSSFYRSCVGTLNIFKSI